MTPKKLLEKHNGDPLAAADDAAVLLATIAHLGEDGAEKWGRALWAVVLWAGLNTRFTFAEFWELYKPFNALHFDGFTQITRIANASDRERLAARIVALAEVEK